MHTSRSEYPKQPHISQTELPRVHPPTVLVFEKQAWEYRVISKNVADGPLSENDLNALGAVGWELVGVVTVTTNVQFFFKRVRS